MREASGDGEFIRQQWRMWIETSFWSLICTAPGEFIRQQWRMWIETPPARPPPPGATQFIRQQWRMWIETVAATGEVSPVARIHSPAMANVD